MSRKVFTILLFLICLTLQAQQTIKMGLFPLEPFMIEKDSDGNIGGITVEYWKEYVAPKMSAEIEIVGIFPAMRVMNMLENGQIDVIPLMTKTQYRWEHFLFPKSRLTEIISCLILHPDSELIKVRSQKDLYDLKVAFLDTAYVPPIMDHPRIHIETVSGVDYREINLKKLFSKRVDAQLDINYLSLMYYLEQRGLTDKVRIILLPTENEPVYCIFQNSVRGRELCRQFEEINKKALKNNVFEKLARKRLKPYYEILDSQ